MKTKPYTWIVRFDVAPMWVADGFALSDERALNMLGRELGYACMSTELAARVLSAPQPLRVMREQGYAKNDPDVNTALREYLDGTPHAFPTDSGTLDRILCDAIDLLNSVAFVREDGDPTADVLKSLRKARGILRGNAPISDIEWGPAE